MFVQPVFKLPDRERGQGLVEYALVLVFIAVVVIAILTIFGEDLHYTYCRTVYTLSLDSDADISSACTRPIIVTEVNELSSTALNLEAKVYDPDGDANSIDKVEFYIDGNHIRTEGAYRFCLGAGDASCNNQNISGLSSGKHVVTMVAYDDNGETGELNYTFTKP